MPKRLKKLSEEVLHENPWWKYKHDTYEKPNGGAGDYFYGELPGNSMIIPVLEDGRIVLTLQYRYLMDRQSIEFPCGGRAEGELPLDTAKKELFEEAGCKANDFVKVGTFQALNGVIKDECHLFIAYIEEQGEQHLDDTEDIELLYRRPDQIEDMIRRGDIWDGQTLAAWALARHILLSENSVPEEKTFISTITDLI